MPYGTISYNFKQLSKLCIICEQHIAGVDSK